MDRLVIQEQEIHDSPDILVKTTLGCALVAVIILTPFTINNFIQGRYISGLFTLLVTALATLDVWLCYQGKYSQTINLYLVTPSVVFAIVFTMYEIGAHASYWPFLGILSFYFILPEKRAWIVNVVFLLIIIPVAWNILEHGMAARFIAVLFGASIFAFISMREIYKLNNLLKEQAITDTLTGLYNRTLLQESLEHAIHQRNRTGLPMAIIMLDLDYFKLINDELGHEEGDSVLKSIGKYLKTHTRGSDMVFRIGGEEFLMLIYNTPAGDSLDIAEKLRSEIEHLPLLPDRKVTASLGVSSLQPDISWKEWVRRCDNNLYTAKSNGRNQVVA